MRLRRAALASGTALGACALVSFAQPSLAQVPPSTHPTGGQVAAGQAAISTNGGTVVVNQKSQNAVINWQTYNLGSSQTIQYNQPNSAAFLLNRVIAANPSVIAGRILANGRIAIVNQSGVVFVNGATVNTAGLVVSAANLTDQDFMAGRLVFSQPPHPGAVVSNAGNITVQQAGLAALVAPRVANSGTITAQLGHVVLGGASTYTLDLYGDGLTTLNVTGQVTQVQLDGRSVPALVTNIGTILVPGGTVVLTAQAAAGVISTAVSAGGVIAAPTAGQAAGRVLVSGIGGDVEIDGAVSATGTAVGTHGGQIAVASNQGVVLAGGAVLDASGAAGGGAVSVGSSLPPGMSGTAPPGALTASTTVVAQGAVVRANATRTGNGGRISIVAIGSAQMHGTLTANAGPGGGNGGEIGIAARGLSVDGVISAATPHGGAGSVTFSQTGALTLCDAGCTIAYRTLLDSAADTSIIDTNGSVDFETSALTRGDSFGNIQVIARLVPGTSGLSPDATGNVQIDSGAYLLVPRLAIDAAGNVDIFGTVSSGHGTDAGITIAAGDQAVGGTSGGVFEGSGGRPPSGAIITDNLAITARNGDIDLEGAANQITTVLGVSAGGYITLDDSVPLEVAGAVSAGGTLSLSAGGGGTPSLLIDADMTAQSVYLSATGGVTVASFGAQGGPVVIDAIGSRQAGTGTIAITAAAGNITVGGTLLAQPGPGGPGATGTVLLDAGDGNVTERFAAAGGNYTGTIVTGTLVAQAGAPGGAAFDVLLDGPNQIGALGAGAVNGVQLRNFAGGAYVLTDDAALTIASSLQAGNISLDVAGTGPNGKAANGLSIDANLAGGDVSLFSAGSITEAAWATVAAFGPDWTGTAASATGIASGMLTLGSAAGGVDFAGTACAGVLTGYAQDGFVLSNSGNAVRALDSILVQNGPLDLADGIALVQRAGTVVRAGQGQVAISATNFIQDAGSVISGERIAIAVPNTISLGGTLIAPQILLSGPEVDGHYLPARDVIWNANRIVTGASPGARRANVPNPYRFNIAGLANPIGGDQGIFVYTRDFRQSGFTEVGGMTSRGGIAATIDIELAANGTATFGTDAAAGQGLFAPDAQLMLALGPQAGVTGNIDVAALNIYALGGVPIAPGAVDLTGIVGGNDGFEAAAAVFMHGTTAPGVELNDCALAGTGCSVFSPFDAPLLNPVDSEPSLVMASRDEDDDLLLQNVARQDY